MVWFSVIHSFIYSFYKTKYMGSGIELNKKKCRMETLVSELGGFSQKWGKNVNSVWMENKLILNKEANQTKRSFLTI